MDPLAIGSFDLFNTTAKRMNSEGLLESTMTCCARKNAVPSAKALAELPETQQQLLLLLVADPPVPYCEIGRRMNLPIGSIGPTRARLLKKLEGAAPCVSSSRTSPVRFPRPREETLELKA